MDHEGGGNRILALIATSLTAIAVTISSFQAYISWSSLQQYRESFLFSKRAEVCVNFLRDVRDETDQLTQAGQVAERNGSNNDRYSGIMNRLLGSQSQLNGHMSFVILGTPELAADAEALEKSLEDAVAVASADGATKAQIDGGVARTIGPRARLQLACMALARGVQ